MNGEGGKARQEPHFATGRSSADRWHFHPQRMYSGLSVIASLRLPAVSRSGIIKRADTLTAAAPRGIFTRLPKTTASVAHAANI